MSAWIAVWDTETTGVDVENDRIVTSYLGLMDQQGEITQSWEWLINPGIDIPAEASAVHGVSTERAIAEGDNPKDALQDMRWRIENVLDLPLVAFNLPYDLTIFNRECRRWGLATLPELEKAIDPLVIDKAIDMYRKGSRKLVDVAKHYHVRPPEGGAHSADYDAVLAGRIAVKLRPELRRRHSQAATTEEFWPWMMDFQRNAKLEQAASFQKYLRKTEPDAVIDGSWPLKPFSVVA